MSEKPLEEKERYLDRELAWVDFNQRVLAEAMDARNPVLEKLKFCGIVSSNFDEFFMVRAAGLEDADPLCRAVYEKAFDVIRRQNEFFLGTLVPEMEKAGIVRLSVQTLDGEQRSYVEKFFYDEILPLLTPITLQEAVPLPPFVNLSLYRIFDLKKGNDGSRHFAVVEAPRNAARIIWLPSGKGHPFVLLEDVLAAWAGELFRGFDILGHGLMRITRGAEMSLDEEKDADFADIMSEALRSRRMGSAVRLEIQGTGEMTAFFQKSLKIAENRIFQNEGWFDLKEISRIAFQSGFEEFKRREWKPQPVREIEESEDVWALLREQDVLVYHPYQSFNAFLRFLSDAARDPDVLAIKQTLYRAAVPSRVVEELVKAAEKGKQVTVLVELKARFDEERNIEWADRLVKAGATVLYGVAGLKTHAKACLVIRREIEGIRRYAHLSTGNYNEKTARLYSDIGFFTSQEEMVRDISAVFNTITGFTQPGELSRITMAPYSLRKKFERLILRESMRSRRDQPGRIMAKMNSLVDPVIIEALYRVSQAGVKVQLNVRGICCLRPGVPGLSENIEVISIVDMFLEHSRIFYFYNGGDEEVYLSSADWMPRNLDRRVEILFPIAEKSKRDIIEVLNACFQDTASSWKLESDGTWKRRETAEPPFRMQEWMMKRFAGRTAEDGSSPVELQPQRPKRTTTKQNPAADGSAGSRPSAAS